MQSGNKLFYEHTYQYDSNKNPFEQFGWICFCIPVNDLRFEGFNQNNYLELTETDLDPFDGISFGDHNLKSYTYYDNGFPKTVKYNEGLEGVFTYE
jgi:hypothetical protein